MTENINEEIVIENLKREIKSLIVKEGYTLDKLANELNTRFNLKESKANLSNKLKRGSLRFIEVQYIMEILGYCVEFKKK